MSAYGLVYNNNSTAAVTVSIKLNNFNINLETLVNKELHASGLDDGGSVTINDNIYISESNIVITNWYNKSTGEYNIYLGKWYQHTRAQNSKYYLTLYYTKN